MKKKLLLLLIILIIGIGSYILMDTYQKHQLVEEAQIKAEEFVYRNYQNVNDVEIDKDNHHFDSMGGLSIGGNINGDEDVYFHIVFMVDGKRIGKLGAVVVSPSFPMEKEECQQEFCE